MSPELGAVRPVGEPIAEIKHIIKRGVGEVACKIYRGEVPSGTPVTAEDPSFVVVVESDPFYGGVARRHAVVEVEDRQGDHPRVEFLSESDLGEHPGVVQSALVIGLETAGVAEAHIDPNQVNVSVQTLEQAGAVALENGELAFQRAA